MIANESASNASALTVSTPRDACTRSHRGDVASGELDVALTVGRSAAPADALSDGMYRLLPGCVHLPYLEAPDDIAAHLAAL